MLRVERTQRALRSYAKGLRSQDLAHLFSREAVQAYSILTRESEEDRGSGFFARLRDLFLGISYHLGPARRLLFCTTVGLAFLGLFDFDLRLVPGLPALDSDPLFHLLAIAGLIYLLALELVDRVQVRDELEVARQLQHELLPRQAPATPGYTFAHSYRTAREIGGDYYDFFPVADGRLAIVAGDASGHGIAAGLLMVIAKSTLELAVGIDPDPARVTQLLNRSLYDTGGTRAFMTLFYGLLDPISGRLDYVCAGHPFPLLRRPGGELEELGRGGLPLGLRAELEISTASTTLRPGDLLTIYSDGFPESVRTGDQQAFGFERIHQIVRRGGSPADLHRRVVDEHRAFLGGEAPHDDVSIVVVGRIPSEGTTHGRPGDSSDTEQARRAS